MNKVWIGISGHWPNSIFNCCLFVPSPQWLHFIYTSRISKAAPGQETTYKKSQCRSQKRRRKLRPGRPHNTRDISPSGGLKLVLAGADSPHRGTRGRAPYSRREASREAAALQEMEQTGELSVTAKTLSTDSYLQITELMQAHASERGNIIFSLLLDSNHRLFQEDFTKLTEVTLFPCILF